VPTDKVMEALARVERTAHNRQHGIDEWKAAIRAALDAGAQVTTVARMAGVSRARVYQIRDGE
jgi:hypothetical protein